MSGCSGQGDPAPADSSAESSADSGAGSGSTPAQPTQVDAELKARAEAICAETRRDFEALGDDIDLDNAETDPLLDAVIRPGAEIYAREGARFRELTAELTPTVAVSIFVDYFEIIDTVLNARTRVNDEDAPVTEDARSLEGRFQTVAAEQAAFATAAGLTGCSFDAFQTIFGQ